MYDLIVQYGDRIIQTIVILGGIIPLFRKRQVSDQNLISKWEEVKGLAVQLGFKELDISKAVSNLNLLSNSLKDRITKMEGFLNDEIIKINESILEFQNGDLYQKMLNGLSQLDELNELLKNKDTTIEQLAQVIKDIKKKLG